MVLVCLIKGTMLTYYMHKLLLGLIYTVSYWRELHVHVCMYFPLWAFILISWREEQREAIGAVCVCEVLCFLPVLITVAGCLCVCLLYAPVGNTCSVSPQHNLGHGASPPWRAIRPQDMENPNSHSCSPRMLMLDLGNTRGSEEQRIRWVHVLQGLGKWLFLVDKLCLPLQDCLWASLPLLPVHLKIFRKVPQKGFQRCCLSAKPLPYCSVGLCRQEAPLPMLSHFWTPSAASSSLPLAKEVSLILLVLNLAGHPLQSTSSWAQSLPQSSFFNTHHFEQIRGDSSNKVWGQSLHFDWKNDPVRSLVCRCEGRSW